MRAFICVILLFIGACKTEVTPMVRAAEAMLASHRSTANAFKKFVNHPKVVIDAGLKAKIEANILEDLARSETAFNAFVGYAQALGDVDYKELYERLKTIYEDIRRELEL